ncbi:hypothetical protein KZZ05_21300, partial [Marinobacter adhaerens]|uniref:hypothetical protein n=1 Tax=Marinobacter adhaerens TaxID=1033846 RepID=UPI001C5F3B33
EALDAGVDEFGGGHQLNPDGIRAGDWRNKLEEQEGSKTEGGQDGQGLAEDEMAHACVPRVGGTRGAHVR